MPTALATQINLQREIASRMQARRSERLGSRSGARGRRIEDLARYGGGLTGRELVEMAQAARLGQSDD
ncbi:hypothetical protein [Methylobacterium planeticum]|uniref:Uncharacterized protein n=1 Tax=Methylobacterium planeticum TaxID=2615211 RepID=A0A6N6MKD6_9HYPH|nr:hypothetical protein [Methylobacterium planeticum]KAB1071656.1 hypothetical protein F6X51_19035 [Methylobacterium planeticum]